MTIEKNTGETLYREFFYPCKTLRLYSKHGETRTFVEYTEASDHGIRLKAKGLKTAVSNAVLRLIAENNEDFYFDRSEKGAKPIRVGQCTHWLKYDDVTEQWQDHYWTRLKTPLVGFKAVSKNGESIYLSKKEGSIRYSIGKTYSIDEKKMLEGEIIRNFFSPEISKALNYVEKDEKVFLVVATGLVYIKNNWNDLCSSKLTIVRELSKKDIDLLTPAIEKPAVLWNGYEWKLQVEI